MLIVKTINTHDELEHTHKLFISYFRELYRGIASAQLGIPDLTNHLETIWSETIQSIKQKVLQTHGAYENEQLIGFVTWTVEENAHVLFLRTLPVNPLMKEREFEIRTLLIKTIQEQYPSIKKTVFIIRKANESYKLFCQQAGFVEDATIFDAPYIGKRYTNTWYDAYVLKN